MRSLIILWALLFHWELLRILPEWQTHPDELASCRWNRDMDVLVVATCTSLYVGAHGRPHELQTATTAALQWLTDSVGQLADR